MDPALFADAGVPKGVFFSYAHSDVSFLERLEIHMKPLKRTNSIDLWSDRRIRAGQKWQDEIENALQKAAVAVVLISADFLASDFIVNNELPPLLKAAESSGKTIIPVIVSPCRFMQEKTLSQFQAINDPKKPLTKLPIYKREELYVQIVNRIEELI